jgi:glycosyltransferase involved in cell wall biosynthesis
MGVVSRELFFSLIKKSKHSVFIGNESPVRNLKWEIYFGKKLKLSKYFLDSHDPDRCINLRYGWTQSKIQNFKNCQFTNLISKDKNKNILLISFDSTLLPSSKIKEINKNFIQVWCDSLFTCKKAREAGVFSSLLKILPLGVSNRNFYQKEKDIKWKSFRFVNVAGPNMFKIKGHDLLIDVFLKVFRNNDKVELHIKTNDKDQYVKLLHQYVNCKRRELKTGRYPKVIVDGNYIPNRDIYRYLANFNCYVQTSRIETFGLPVLEAASIGLPIIAPNYGGFLDFLTDDFSIKVDVEIKKMKANTWRKNKESFWGEIKKSSLESAFHKVVCEYHKYKKAAIAHSFYIRRKYSWEKTAETAIDLIKELC